MAKAPQFGRDHEAVHAWQHHVEHHEVVELRLRRNPLERVLAGFGEIDLVFVRFKVEAQAGSQVELVFDDEDAAHDAEVSGSCTVKVVPRPGPSLSAKTVPPCRATTARTMKRPRPAPLMRAVMTPGMR